MLGVVHRQIVFRTFNFASIEEKRDLKENLKDKAKVRRRKDKDRIEKYTVHVAKKLKIHSDLPIVDSQKQR